jgi:hypothetical protein
MVSKKRASIMIFMYLIIFEDKFFQGAGVSVDVTGNSKETAVASVYTVSSTNATLA